MEISEQLEKYGLDKRKAFVYLACLELGPSSVQNIAAKTAIKRTTIYDILTSLISQGLISQTIKGKKRLFVAESPEMIRELLQKKEQEFEQILPELKSLHFIPGPKPKIKYYEGIEGVKKVLDDTLTVSNKKLLGILSMVDLFDFMGEEYMESYVQRRIKKNVELRVVRSREKEAEAKRWLTNTKELRERRYSPKGIVFSLAQFIYDNKVCLISSKKENFGLIIESEEFAENQKQLFEVLWQAGDIK